MRWISARLLAGSLPIAFGSLHIDRAPAQPESQHGQTPDMHVKDDRALGGVLDVGSFRLESQGVASLTDDLVVNASGDIEILGRVISRVRRAWPGRLNPACVTLRA